MAYCTRQDLERRYGERELIQLTDRDGSAGAVVDAVLEEAIADAAAEIDGYLTDGGYALPLDPVPYLLTRRACSLTRFHLYDDLRPDTVREDAERARSWLERVATGAVRLALADGRAGTGAGAVEMAGGRKEFAGGGY